MRRPVRVVVEPSALSAVHCTLTGSGMYPAYVDPFAPALEREIVVRACDEFGNPIGKALPGMKEGFLAQLRNTNPDLTNPMVEVQELGEA